MNKIIRLALVLFAVSAIVAGVLGVVNALTAPVIDAQKQAKPPPPSPQFWRRSATTRLIFPIPISRPFSPCIRPGTPVMS